jgi:hypothetical protein
MAVAQWMLRAASSPLVCLVAAPIASSALLVTCLLVAHSMNPKVTGYGVEPIAGFVFGLFGGAVMLASVHAARAVLRSKKFIGLQERFLAGLIASIGRFAAGWICAFFCMVPLLEALNRINPALPSNASFEEYRRIWDAGALGGALAGAVFMAVLIQFAPSIELKRRPSKTWEPPLVPNETDTLARLQAWYAARCDGDWEHQNGIRIGTLDNPGWQVAIDLAGTPLADRQFIEVREGLGADGHPDFQRWLRCWVEGGKWHAAGDESQLARALELFLNWIGGSAP